MSKNVLTFKEACEFLDYAPSYLYKLTSASKVPYSKPTGKKLKFSREELEKWMLGNPSTSDETKDRLASTHVSKNLMLTH
jgi:excisionase family DNA binding protein